MSHRLLGLEGRNRETRQEGPVVTQMRDDVGLGCSLIVKKASIEYIFKVRLTEFACGLVMGCERKRNQTWFCSLFSEQRG